MLHRTMMSAGPDGMVQMERQALVCHSNEKPVWERVPESVKVVTLYTAQGFCNEIAELHRWNLALTFQKFCEWFGHHWVPEADGLIDVCTLCGEARA